MRDLSSAISTLLAKSLFSSLSATWLPSCRVKDTTVSYFNKETMNETNVNKIITTTLESKLTGIIKIMTNQIYIETVIPCGR